jgi:16S rRNA (cytidine1402-2'-O)-methyltransferase
VLTALSVAALPDRPLFLRGILAAPRQARRGRGSRKLAEIDATLVMFESGNRVQDTLAISLASWAARRAILPANCTNLHEESSAPRSPIWRRPPITLETRGEFVARDRPAARTPMS